MSKQMFEVYRGAMAYIEVRLPNGDLHIGSSFHVGEGVFVTARHVLEGNEIVSMATTERYYEPDETGSTFITWLGVPDEKGNLGVAKDPTKYRTVFPKALTVKSGPYFHPRADIDVAAIIVNENDFTAVPLGDHLDDWIIDSDFVMSETLMMGYPPIPFSTHPILIAARGEVNGVVDKYNGPHPHFIVSAVPRGGFSGGLCVINIYGGIMALGVIVESLVYNNREIESGFMSVLTVEPIYVCLQHHNILPKNQNQFF